MATVTVHDDTGTIAVDPDYGMVYYLTECCAATAKGSADADTGVVCRACYGEIDPMLGMAWGSIADYLAAQR